MDKRVNCRKSTFWINKKTDSTLFVTFCLFGWGQINLGWVQGLRGCFFGAVFLHPFDWVARNQLPLEYVPSIESFASSFRDLPLRFDWWISLTGFRKRLWPWPRLTWDMIFFGIYMYVYIYIYIDIIDLYDSESAEAISSQTEFVT